MCHEPVRQQHGLALLEAGVVGNIPPHALTRRAQHTHTSNYVHARMHVQPKGLPPRHSRTSTGTSTRARAHAAVTSATAATQLWGNTPVGAGVPADGRRRKHWTLTTYMRTDTQYTPGVQVHAAACAAKPVQRQSSPLPLPRGGFESTWWWRSRWRPWSDMVLSAASKAITALYEAVPGYVQS